MDSRSAATQNIEKLEAAIEELAKLLRGMGTWDLGKQTPAREALATKVGPAASSLLQLLDYQFEDAARLEALKKNTAFRRLTNFTKMVKQYSLTRNYEDVLSVMQDQQTAKDFATQKFGEYAREAVGLLSYFDSEVEETFVQDGWTVTLVSARGLSVSQDYVEKLREVLRRVDRLMTQGGLGKATGGRLFAYTGKTLGGSASNMSKGLASYQSSKDLVKVALAAPLSELVHSMVHELGHRVWFKILGSQGRAAWGEFFGKNSGDPDVDQIIADWSGFAFTGATKYPEALGHYMYHLRQRGDAITVRWLNMLADQLGITEVLDPMTGKPKGKGPSAFEQLVSKRQEANVFLYPVSAYSGTNPGELFAEVLAYLLAGGGPVEPLVRAAFRAAVPQLKMAASRYSYDRRNAKTGLRRNA